MPSSENDKLVFIGSQSSTLSGQLITNGLLKSEFIINPEPYHDARVIYYLSCDEVFDDQLYAQLAQWNGFRVHSIGLYLTDTTVALDHSFFKQRHQELCHLLFWDRKSQTLTWELPVIIKNSSKNWLSAIRDLHNLEVPTQILRFDPGNVDHYLEFINQLPADEYTLTEPPNKSCHTDQPTRLMALKDSMIDESPNLEDEGDDELQAEEIIKQAFIDGYNCRLNEESEENELQNLERKLDEITMLTDSDDADSEQITDTSKTATSDNVISLSARIAKNGKKNYKQPEQSMADGTTLSDCPIDADADDGDNISDAYNSEMKKILSNLETSLSDADKIFPESNHSLVEANEFEDVAIPEDEVTLSYLSYLFNEYDYYAGKIKKDPDGGKFFTITDSEEFDKDSYPPVNLSIDDDYCEIVFHIGMEFPKKLKSMSEALILANQFNCHADGGAVCSVYENRIISFQRRIPFEDVLYTSVLFNTMDLFRDYFIDIADELLRKY